jgi:hypothetical protein
VLVQRLFEVVERLYEAVERFYEREPVVFELAPPTVVSVRWRYGFTQRTDELYRSLDARDRSSPRRRPPRMIKKPRSYAYVPPDAVLVRTSRRDSCGPGMQRLCAFSWCSQGSSPRAPTS